MMLKIILFLVTLLFLAVPAYANAGVPMIALAMPGMAISLIPIIFFESWYIHLTLNVSARQAFKAMVSANIESTIIGIPLTWIAWVLIEMSIGYVGAYMGESLSLSLPNEVSLLFAVTIGAAWLGPVESDLYWMVPTAAFVLLIPFFYVSYLLERGMAKRFLKGISVDDIHKSVFKANVYSYGSLALIVVGWLIVSLVSGTDT